MAPLLSIAGASKAFGAIQAVRNISLSVDKGEVLGIAGPNGSGKSTLFNIITRTPFGPDSGRVVLDGTDISALRPHQIARLGMVRTFQRESVFATLSAIDNVLVAVENSSQRGRFVKNLERAEWALALADFPSNMHNSKAGALPVFLRKLIMIASALSMKPKVLLLDEPASGLTPHEIARIQALILKLRPMGMAILLIEHVLPLLTSVSDRLAVFDYGTLIAYGVPADVIADRQVIEAYLGKNYESPGSGRPERRL